MCHCLWWPWAQMHCFAAGNELLSAVYMPEDLQQQQWMHTSLTTCMALIHLHTKIAWLPCRG